MKKVYKAAMAMLAIGMAGVCGCTAPRPAGLQSGIATVDEPAADPLVLVENGVSLAPVVVFENAPPYTRRAADELADYIEKVAGARPAVLEGTPDPIPERAIWVGYQPALDALFPELDFDFRHPEEILIAANARHLVIAGRDVWDPDFLRVDGGAFQFGLGSINGFQNEYGTANAVYTFLMDYLGVRWLWPGEDGEDVPEAATIAFEPFAYRYHPQIRQRHSMFALYLALYRHGGRLGLPASDWARFNRVQLDSLYVPTGHGFNDWFDRFHDKHPEYFALQPDGTRSGFPGANHAKLCEANPAVWRQWLRDVEAAVERHRFRNVFSAAANDASRSGHCICEDCRAWDHPDAELVSLAWRGVAQDYVALSDRQVIFANRLAELLDERFPDSDEKVVILAYGPSRIPPVDAMAGDRVIVGMVFNFFQRHMPEHRERFIGWTQKAKHSLWRPNIGSGRRRFALGGPVNLTSAMEDFRLIGESGTIGISMDTVHMYWATQGPLYYLMAQLAWNPFQDGREVMADYYERGFGPAAKEIADYWNLLEKLHRKLEIDSAEFSARAAWAEAFTPEVFGRADALLRDAEAKVEGERDVFARRVAYVRAGLDFLRLTTENLALNLSDDAAFARAKANWAQIERISREYPFALNERHVQNNPAGNRLSDIFPRRD